MKIWDKYRQYKLDQMTEEELIDFLDVPDDYDNSDDDQGDGDFDSDDSVNDPDYVIDKPHESFTFPKAIGTSITVDDLGLTLATPSTSAQPNLAALSASSSDSKHEPQAGPSTSRRSHKRARSQDRGVSEAPSEQSIGRFVGDVLQISNKNSELQKIMWKKSSLQLNIGELGFQPKDPSSQQSFRSPYECFAYFVDDELLALLVEQTNLYAKQQNISTTFNCTVEEMRKYIAILIFTSVFRYPNIRSYWGQHSLEAVRESMRVNRFEEIRSHLHFADVSKRPSKESENYDPLYSIRDIVNHFNMKFSSIPMIQRLCVDEQMCSTKMKKTNIRQYMPNKPHKWGFKLFVLCDTNGFSYAFEIYCGAGDNKVPQGAPDLGASSNIVIRLSRGIPDFANHVLYFDNFYTSLGLMVYLRSRGIHSLGTIRANRIPNCKLSSDEKLREDKRTRGYAEEYVGTAYGVDIANVLWNDNKGVRLASTYVGIQPFLSREEERPQKAIRWNRSAKVYDEVDCPNIIKEYNRHMGGVDLMDGLIGRYKIRMKTKKWTCRLFYHMIDLAMVNAYVLYHRLNRESWNERFELPSFRTRVAEVMIKMGTVKRKTAGRPSTASKQAEDKEVSEGAPKLAKTLYVPPAEVRYDNIGHWCVFRDRSAKRQCKMKGCRSETQAYCEKCNIPLCNSTKKSCFRQFHTK